MMKHLDLTLPTPGENLALDEALLDLCEEGYSHEILRFWEPKDYFVVLGYSNKISAEVNLSYCRSYGIPVLRRASGGGTVLQGPGCLNYALILRTERSPELVSITRTNLYVMERHRSALESILGRKVCVEGHTDLACDLIKFSGNAQRRRKKFFLFHGTFLARFDIEMIEKTLLMPGREPAYRNGRRHRDFVANLHAGTAGIKNALKAVWETDGALEEIPLPRVGELMRIRYGCMEWHEKF